MSVFTISRCYGLNEEELLRQFAEKHGYLIFSQELLVEVARESELPVEELQNTYNMEKFSTFKAFIQDVIHNFNNGSFAQTGVMQPDMPEFYPLYYPFMTLTSGNQTNGESRKSYIEIMGKVIKEIAARDNVIIVGRGAQVVLKDFPDCYHLRLEGLADKKIARVMEKEHLNEKEAAGKIKSADKHRSAYMEYFYNVDNQDPALYHFVINTDLLSMDKVIRFMAYLSKN